jgi:hypothetical protein
MMIRSLEPGENWAYCYADDLFIEPAPTPLSGKSSGSR